MTRYEKEIEKNKVIIYKLSDENKLEEVAKILQDEEDSKRIKIIFQDKNGWYIDDTKEYIENFGVESFRELKELSPKDLGLMIWGNE
ncbi:hypothetical protein AFV8_gp15 [Betalipothrixvirus puteoliense]|uniref:Uncharacterized protein n=1 Tax=Betalipothrixvirus puteoliense TaxID=346884 RepID=A7WKU5_9VIRU|nr:hypothetical protein AFV8_gp15 [Acidianus filamentous virus 8]CAJ31692.1 conserved hypothetical protein [Acidianus filamentous virus 8]